MLRHVYLVSILAGLIFEAGLHAEDAKPRFIVSLSILGVTGGGGAQDADALAAHLSSGGWCTAAAAGAYARPIRWNKRPEKIPTNEWVSVVLCGFGVQAHAFVFMFDGPHGAPRLLAHVPYKLSVMPSGAKQWFLPVGQIANSFSSEYRRNPIPVQTAAGALVSIKIGAEEAKADAPENAGAATVTFGEALSAMEAMLCAALCENGWTPTWEQTEQSIRLDLRFAFKSVFMRVTRQVGNASNFRRKEGIPEDHYFGFLTRLLYALKADTGIADFTWMGSGRFQLLAATAERVCGAGDGGIAAYDPRNGKRLWASVAAKIPDTFDSLLDDGGHDRVLRISNGVATVNLAAGGAQKVLAPVAPGVPWAVAVRDDGTVVVARLAALSAYRNGTLLWQKEEASNITAGPAMTTKFIFIGTADGDLICRGIEDGAEKWRKGLGGELRGHVVASVTTILAFTKNEDAVVALNANDGAVIWKQVIGDVLLKAPIALNGQYLVIGKNNRIVLLNSTDGKIAAEVHWPTWVVDAIPVTVDGRSLVVCSDIRGKLSFLDAANLKVLREVPLPARPSGGLKFVREFPSLWGAADTDPLVALTQDDPAGKPKPAILVTDGEGFCYIVKMK